MLIHRHDLEIVLTRGFQDDALLHPACRKRGTIPEFEPQRERNPKPVVGLPVDFHLVAGASDAIDQGSVVDAPGVDIDGQPHTLGAAPDIGADESGM